MATYKEIIFIENNIVNVIQLKPSANQKIGLGIAVFTYHFSIDQIKAIDLKLDKKNCLDCPLSYSAKNKIGTCYTHKGTQKLGLGSMLKRLNRLHNANKINSFSESEFVDFLDFCKRKTAVSLVRFGAYGEPVFLGENVVARLSDLGPTTGYTHQYKKEVYNWSKKFFMASTHNTKDLLKAKSLGFRNFTVIPKKDDQTSTKGLVNCPASAESKKDLSCIACRLCNGKKTNIKKDIYILSH